MSLLRLRSAASRYGCIYAASYLPLWLYCSKEGLWQRRHLLPELVLRGKPDAGMTIRNYMRMAMRLAFPTSVLPLSAIVSFCILSGASAVSALSYSMVDIGDLPGGADATYARGLNELGQVVGYGATATGYHAFLWDSGVLTDLGVVAGGSESYALGINDAGQIVGYSTRDGVNHAILWESGAISDLGNLPGGTVGSYATAINNAGQIVGFSSADDSSRGFVWSDGVMTDIGAAYGGTDDTFALGISDDGSAIVGYFNDGTVNSAALWKDGEMIEIGNLPGGHGSAFAYGVNDSGAVVGYTSSSTGPRAFLWEDGVLTNLGDLPGGLNYSQAMAINASGQIVGRSGSEAGVHAFVWKNGKMVDLNGEIDALLGVSLVNAYDVNDKGQILAIGKTASGANHAFLLTPLAVPVPAGLPLLSSGFLMLAVSRRRLRRRLRRG
ncbi:hypothetical protein [Tropicimonas sp. IMCC34043]|uniref:hypothetical protein n=1 Tax=Tropicimonas sp. IMCC34043 TaxID=2248760 RepID=UPI0013005A2B|nr:hypothetical protein [Tropicimonas sp. IMCC34043]